MSTIRPIAFAAAMCVCLSAGLGTAAAAQDKETPPAEPERRPEAILDDLVDQLQSTLRGLLEAIPQYEMPEINEHGDIIIRRKRPGREQDQAVEQTESLET